MKYKRFISIAMLMAIFFVFISTCFAQTPSPAPTPSPSIRSEESEDTPWYRVDAKIGKMYESIKEITESIRSFFEDGLTGVVEKTNGIVLESCLNKTSFDGKWVFSTPTLIEFSWVRNLWWFCFAFSMISLALGIGISVLKVFAGKRSDSSIRLLRSFIIAVVGCSLSLYISDKLIETSNLFINSVARQSLVEEYKKPENQSAILLTNLDEKKIGFDSFDGKSLAKMAFGSPLNDGKPLYESFMSKNGGAGLIIMSWAMFCFILMGLLSTLRYGTLGILGGFSSLWISGCAWTGDETALTGYINLFVRSIAMSFIFDGAWLISYFVINNPYDFQGLGPQIVSCCVFTIAIILSIKIWFKWFAKSLFKPASLAGEDAKKWFSTKFEKVGSTSDKIRKRFSSSGSKKGNSSSVSLSKTSSKDYNTTHKEPDIDNKNSNIDDRLKDAENKSSKRPEVKALSASNNFANTSYYKDSKGSYHYYNDTLKKTVKHSTPPKNGVDLKVVKSSEKERSNAQC